MRFIVHVSTIVINQSQEKMKALFIIPPNEIVDDGLVIVVGLRGMEYAPCVPPFFML
jgi:hypothetical protein